MMAALTPYSTFRTDSKQIPFPQASSHGNVLTFTPPGFTQQLNVKFPDSRLAVCAKCKKNFKTRDMCRVRNAHSGAPWTTAFICITIDASCLDENNKFVDKPMTVRMIQWQPFCVRKAFDPKTPVCSACKRTNRTRSFCRERHKHRQLPWCTVYVLLSAQDSIDPSTAVAGPSVKVYKAESNDESGRSQDLEKNVKSIATNIDGEDRKQVEKFDVSDKQSTSVTPTDPSKEKFNHSNIFESDTIGSDPGDTGDDIMAIAESRTFLAKVSSRSSTIHWLDLTDLESQEGSAYPSDRGGDDHHLQQPSVQHTAPTMVQMPHYMDANQAVGSQYYQATASYAAQQHQNALKSRQQYPFQHPHAQQYHASMHNQYNNAGHHWGPPGQLGISYNPHLGMFPPGESHITGGNETDALQQHYQQRGMLGDEGHDSGAVGHSPSANGRGNDEDQQTGHPSSNQHMVSHPGHPPPVQWAMYYQPPLGTPYPPSIMSHDMTAPGLGSHHQQQMPQHHFMAGTGGFSHLRQPKGHDDYDPQYQDTTGEGFDDQDNKRRRML